MLKRFLLAVATVVCCSTSMFAQDDLFLSFSDTALITDATAGEGASGSAYIFSREGLSFRGLDLNINGTDGSVAAFTDAEIFLDGAVPPPPLDVAGARSRFVINGSSILTDTELDASAAVVALPEVAGGPVVGVDGGSALDPAVAGVGVLVGRIDFDTLSEGETTFILGFNDPNGIIDVNNQVVQDSTTLGSGITLTVESSSIPEPSSAALLVMGLVGFTARRRR